MMITLMLAVALITIGLLAVLPDIKQQVQRDREEELRHRGNSYMRAIQHFFKKFGRYPSRVEELENTNNIRFLRKRYTDPMSRDPKTGKEKDFKFLHQQDIALNNGPVLPGQNGPGGVGGPGGLPGQGGFGGAAPGGFGSTQGGLGGLGAQTGGLQQTGGAGGQTSGTGDSGNSSSGNSDVSGNSNSSGSSSSNSNTSSNSGSGFNGPTFGGGPILGVASTSKAKTIRVFFDKSHYNDWFFIYVQQLDRGGLLVGPVNPNLPPAGNLNGLTPGQPAAGMPGQGFGGQGLGQGQGLMPNAGQTPVAPTQPQQNSGPTPPQQ